MVPTRSLTSVICEEKLNKLFLAQSISAPTKQSSNDETELFDADCLSIKSSLFTQSERSKPELDESNVYSLLTIAERESFFAPLPFAPDTT